MARKDWTKRFEEWLENAARKKKIVIRYKKLSWPRFVLFKLVNKLYDWGKLDIMELKILEVLLIGTETEEQLRRVAKIISDDVGIEIVLEREG